MKTRILNSSALLLPGLMFFALLVSCRGEEILTVKRSMFYETATQKSFNLEDQTQINELITVLAKEKNEIKIIEDAEVVDLTDIQGDFKAISVQYKTGDRITRMIVPVEEVAIAKGTNAGYSVPAESCIMKFSGKETECGYEIIERCKTLSVSSAGSTSVTFSDNDNFKSAITKASKSLFHLAPK